MIGRDHRRAHHVGHAPRWRLPVPMAAIRVLGVPCITHTNLVLQLLTDARAGHIPVLSGATWITLSQFRSKCLARHTGYVSSSNFDAVGRRIGVLQSLSTTRASGSNSRFVYQRSSQPPARRGVMKISKQVRVGVVGTSGYTDLMHLPSLTSHPAYSSPAFVAETALAPRKWHRNIASPTFLLTTMP